MLSLNIKFFSLSQATRRLSIEKWYIVDWINNSILYVFVSWILREMKGKVSDRALCIKECKKEKQNI